MDTRVNKFIENKIVDCAKYELTSKDEHILSTKGMEEFILRKLMSRKFRRWAIDDKTLQHVKSSIKLNVNERKPISFISSWGGYKMWQLPSYPYPDLADLFTVSYYCSYLSSIAKAYKPGVKLYLFSDEYVAGMVNNIPKESLEKYSEAFRLLGERFNSNLPNNMSIHIVGVRDIYEDQELRKEFLKNLANFLENGVDATEERIKHLNKLSETNIIWDGAENWLLLSDNEKILKITQTPMYMDAYYTLQKRVEFVRDPYKIMISPLPLPVSIPVGTTKNSVVKFWSGVGVIETKSNSYVERILSANQYDEALKLEHKSESIAVAGLDWFNEVKVFKKSFDFSIKK